MYVLSKNKKNNQTKSTQNFHFLLLKNNMCSIWACFRNVNLIQTDILSWHRSVIVRHRNLEYQPKRAIPSIENVFAFFERGYIVDYKTK